MTPKTEQALQVLCELGIARTSDFVQRGINREYLTVLVERGEIVRVSRGLYALPESTDARPMDLLEAFAAVPNGVLCLLSALRFHEIGTQAPFQHWMAVNRRSRISVRVPSIVRIVRYSETTFELGMSMRERMGVQVRVYEPARTVIDCFKFRRLVGLDVALEALRDARANRLVTMQELQHWAEVLNAGRLMRPYLEMAAQE